MYQKATGNQMGYACWKTKFLQDNLKATLNQMATASQECHEFATMVKTNKKLMEAIMTSMLEQQK